VVLKTLLEHDLQDSLKTDRRTGNSVYAQKGNSLIVMVISRPEVVF
jgi:hypothetical protein